MELLKTLLVSLSYGLAYCLALYILSPAIKTWKDNRWGILLIITTLVYGILGLDSISSVIIVNLIFIISQRSLFKTSFFVSSVLSVIIYLLIMVTSVYTVSVCFILKRQLYEMINIFKYFGNAYVLFIFSTCYLIVLSMYSRIIKEFQKIRVFSERRELMVLFMNLICSLIFIIESRFFILMLQLKTTTYYFSTYYFFISYTMIALLLLVLIWALDRIIITESNLNQFKIRAERDPLTGVLSGDAGLKALKSKMFKSQINHEPLTISFIDVNGLKKVNDKWGHKEGDRLILTISKVIQESLRENDKVLRLGGDEFLLVLYKCNVEDAKMIWQRICEKCDVINSKNDLPYSISASVGFTQFDKTKHRTMEALIEEADAKMYRNKKKSKMARVN